MAQSYKRVNASTGLGALGFLCLLTLQAAVARAATLDASSFGLQTSFVASRQQKQLTVSNRPVLPGRGRGLLQEEGEHGSNDVENTEEFGQQDFNAEQPPLDSMDDDVVCFENCYESPNMDQDPLPIFLFAGVSKSADGSDQCVTLEDCYTAAKLNNLTYFGIVDQIYCFGGSDLRTVEDDWVDSSVCRLACIPGSDGYPGSCGGPGVGVFFSMGACAATPPPMSPIHPDQPPSSPPSASPPPQSPRLSSSPSNPPPAHPPPRTPTQPDMSSSTPPPTSPALPTAVPPGFCPRGCALTSDVGAVEPSYVFDGISCKATALAQGKPGYALGYDINNGIVCYPLEAVPEGNEDGFCLEWCYDFSPDAIDLTCGSIDGEYVNLYQAEGCDSSVSPPPPSVPPSNPLPSSPGASGKTYSCKAGVALWGASSARSKLNPTWTQTYAETQCRLLCDEEQDCKGYYYKTTGWCYRMSGVSSFSKPYSTSMQACRVV